MMDGGGDTPWSDLHPDLLLAVFACLGFVHQLAFRGVCRAWRSAALSAVPDPDRPLWLIRPNRKWGSGLQGKLADFDFVDQSSGRAYRTTLPELKNCFILMARHGWLLVGDEYEDNYRYRRVSFRPIFFNPFSRTAIKLPTFDILDYSSGIQDFWFDFSAPPTSRHCIVFVVSSHSWYSYPTSHPPWSRRHLLSTWTFKPTMSRWRDPRHHPTVDPVWLNDLTMVQLPGGKYVCGDESRQLVGEVLTFHPLSNQFKPLSSYYPAMGKMILCSKLEPVTAQHLLSTRIFPLHKEGGCPYVEEGLVDHSVRIFSDPFTISPSPFLWVDGEEIVIGSLDTSRLGYHECFIRTVRIRPWWAEPAPGFEWVSDFLAAEEMAELQGPPCGLCEAISELFKRSLLILEEKMWDALFYCGRNRVGGYPSLRSE